MTNYIKLYINHCCETFVFNYFHPYMFIKVSFDKVRPQKLMQRQVFPFTVAIYFPFIWHWMTFPGDPHRVTTPSGNVYNLLSMSASLAFSSSSFFLRLAASALSASTVSWLPSILRASVAIFPNTYVYTRKCTLFLCGRGRIAWIWTVCRTNQEICKNICIAWWKTLNLSQIHQFMLMGCKQINVKRRNKIRMKYGRIHFSGWGGG